MGEKGRRNVRGRRSKEWERKEEQGMGEKGGARDGRGRRSEGWERKEE